MRHLVLVLAIACGGRPPPKQPPPPLEPKELAALIYADFTRLGDIAQNQLRKCTALTAELKPHVERMKRRRSEVDQMMSDPKRGGELKTELATYAERTRTLVDKIGIDLAATYLACCPKPSEVGVACTEGYQLERVIADLPTY